MCILTEFCGSSSLMLHLKSCLCPPLADNGCGELSFYNLNTPVYTLSGRIHPASGWLFPWKSIWLPAGWKVTPCWGVGRISLQLHCSSCVMCLTFPDLHLTWANAVQSICSQDYGWATPTYRSCLTSLNC